MLFKIEKNSACFRIPLVYFLERQEDSIAQLSVFLAFFFISLYSHIFPTICDKKEKNVRHRMWKRLFCLGQL